MHTTLLATLLSLLSPTTTQDDAGWPAWRGPHHTGAVPEANPPVSWSEEENIAWKAALPGHGKSTPIVHGGRVYVLAALPTREATADELAARPDPGGGRTEVPRNFYAFLVLALDRKSGEVVWEKQVAERLPVTGVHETNGYASFSPITDGERLYVTFGSAGVYALDLESGDVVWSHEIGPQVTRAGWGEGGAPALGDGAVFVVADQENQSRIHALEADSGEVRWVRDRDEGSTWTAPLVVEHDGVTQVIVNGTNAVRSYDAETGEVLWQCDGQTRNAIPTPVTDGEVALCTSGFRGSACLALPLGGRGDLRQVEGGVAWSYSGGTPYVPSPVLVGDRLYLLNGNTGRITCLDVATGEVLLDREHVDLGNVYASPISAGGRIYVVGRDGTTAVLRHGEGLEVLATNVLSEPIDATPAAVGEALFLRSESSLYAIGNP